MSETKIEWADRTWNPLRGCSKVSEGCRNCYAIRVAHRFGGPGQPYEGLTQASPNGPNWTGKVELVPDALEQPFKWHKPQRVFVNSMSDLFHPEVPYDFIHRVWETMAGAEQHTFQILTKRPERMRDWVRKHGTIIGTELPALPNVWLGVSVEDQRAADERIPLLLQTPAAVRFLSCEPLLGPVGLGKWLLSPGWTPSYYDPDNIHGHPNPEPTNEHIQWVIVGGESGPGARPMHPDWAISLRDQCQAAGVEFHFKQWGEWAPATCDNFDVMSHKMMALSGDGTDHTKTLYEHHPNDVELMARIGKKSAGRLLDGREWNEFPEVRR
jgi:protein gp37